MQELAPYASHPKNSKGCLFEDKRAYGSGAYRSPYQHDRDRIIHSRAFRRIQHKTQVFVTTSAGDHYRTRLTHSLEVAQIARTIARSLKLDEDLTEAIALAHDIGHPPFGHDGEDVLAEKMKNYGGFNHNIQALRSVVLLEKQYPHFQGLNLTFETIDGLLKHNGPLEASLKHYDIITELQKQEDFALHEFSCLEAQVAAISDDVAYNNHDLEDGLRAQLITIEDLAQIPHLKIMIDDIKRYYVDCEDYLILREIIRRQITEWVQGILQTTHANLDKIAAANMISMDKMSSDHIRKHDQQTVDFAEQHQPIISDLRKFLMHKVYKAKPERKSMAEQTLSPLFDFYMQKPSAKNDADKAREVCDYIAGMTDVFAINQYEKIGKQKT